MNYNKIKYRNIGGNKMELDILKGLRRNLVLMALLELVCGLFMIILNDKSLDILIVILGIIAAAYGIISFFSWLVKKDKSSAVPVIITTILGIVAGALIIFFAHMLTSAFTLIMGIFAGVFGVIKLPNMFSIKKTGFKKWWIILIPIVLIVGIGIYVGLNALNDLPSSVTSILLGIALILGCAADIIATAGATNVEKQLLVAKEVDMPEDELK